MELPRLGSYMLASSTSEHPLIEMTVKKVKLSIDFVEAW